MAENRESKGETVVVTGATSGIGLAMTRGLLRRGYEVAGLARRPERAGLEHPNLKLHAVDLARIEALPEALAALAGTIDRPVRALVNNAGAGAGGMGHLEQLSVRDIRRTMDLNFLSHAVVTRALLPRLKRQSGPADVVFVGSEAALRGARRGSVYCASKFAVRGFAQALREECAGTNVRVSLINPGAVRTPFFDGLDFEPGGEAGEAIEPEDVAVLLDLILGTRPGTVLDEINLSPMTRVWRRKP